MIKFFRNIRRRLLGENRFSKYLIYAIGEIILVVIGILIALQINNWNENRKLQSEELSLLADIKANLEQTLSDFNDDTVANARLIRIYEKIEKHIEKDLPYTKDLDSAFGVLTFWSSPFITQTGYKTLENRGISLIKNKKLRNDIVTMYEVELVIVIEDYDKGEWTINEAVVNPFFSKHFRRIHENSLRMARPNNYEALKKNEEFMNILSMILRQRKRGLEVYGMVISKIKELIASIEKEIEIRQ